MGSELFLVGVGQGVAAIGSVVGVRLMTGIISPAIYGELSLAFTFVTLSQQLFVGPLSAALTRFFPLAQERNELSGFFAGSRTLVFRISAVMTALCLLGMVFLWGSNQTSYLGLALLTLFFTLLTGYNSLLNSIQNAARQRAVVAWHQAVSQWLDFVAAVGLVIWLGEKPESAMAGYALSALAVLGSQIYFFLSKMPPGSTQWVITGGEWIPRLSEYSLPFVSWGIFTWIQMVSDRWALERFSSTQAVGYYTVLYQLGYYPLVLLTNVFVQFAMPVLFHQAGDGTQAERLDRAQRNTRRLLAGSLGLTALVVIAAALLHRPIFGLLVAPEYREVSALMPVMVLSGGIFACGQIASLAPLNQGKPKVLLWPKIVTGVVGTLINIAGAYWMGLSGEVYANAAFSVLYFLWVLLLLRRNVQE